MKPIWRQKWQNLASKCAQSGLFARSSAMTLRGEAILPSFGFGRFGHLPRRERLENETHFLHFRSSQLVKTIQTKLTSFMSLYPRLMAPHRVEPGYPGSFRSPRYLRKWQFLLAWCTCGFRLIASIRIFLPPMSDFFSAISGPIVSGSHLIQKDQVAKESGHLLKKIPEDL